MENNEKNAFDLFRSFMLEAMQNTLKTPPYHEDFIIPDMPPALKAQIEKEGDYKDFYYRGVRCYIKRQTDGGMFLCGYVELWPPSPLYGLAYDAIQDKHDIPAHGGLTFSEKTDFIAADHHEGFFIGFDCAHADDLLPAFPSLARLGTYKTMDYATSNLMAIVDYLKDNELLG